MSRHAGFFASLQRVEDRLALEEEEAEQNQKQSSDTMATASSPLVLLDHPHPHPTADWDSGGGPALDLLTLTTTRSESKHGDGEEDADDDDGQDDIDRLMALLGLSPPREQQIEEDGGGCDCSGGGGFRAKVVGVVGPKCDGEKRRLDAWIHHLLYRRKKQKAEPARLAHLLLAKHAQPQAFPATVKDFLEHTPFF